MSWIGWVTIVILGIIALNMCLIGYLCIRYEVERNGRERKKW